MKPREIVIEQTTENYSTESYETTSPITWMDNVNFTAYDSNKENIFDWSQDVNNEDGYTTTTTTPKISFTTDSNDKLRAEFVDNSNNEDYTEPFVEGENSENFVTENPHLTTQASSDTNEQFLDYDELFQKQLMTDGSKKLVKSLSASESSFADQTADNESEIERLEEMDLYRMATTDSTTQKPTKITTDSTTPEPISTTEDDDLPTSIKIIGAKPSYHGYVPPPSPVNYFEIGNENFFDEWERNRQKVLIPLYPKKDGSNLHNRHGHGHQPAEKTISIGTWTTLNPTPSSTYVSSNTMTITSTTTSTMFSSTPKPLTTNPNKLNQRIREVVEPKLFKRPKQIKGDPKDHNSLKNV